RSSRRIGREFLVKDMKVNSMRQFSLMKWRKPDWRVGGNPLKKFGGVRIPHIGGDQKAAVCVDGQ
ncbi:MAG: hypothetical protein WBM14_14180, partial [Terracidiphilus sp.]